ncbi:hypothetical protein A343_0521 [Porphyromonas gingivalis JCVI SC001]|nr:hypothetical protein A343_0521 [Porphyromonas gingivalis JCVI SC001]
MIEKTGLFSSIISKKLKRRYRHKEAMVTIDCKNILYRLKTQIKCVFHCKDMRH